jgi:hypothetical protein
VSSNIFQMSEGRVTIKLEGKALEAFEALQWELHAKSLAALGVRLLLEAMATYGKVIEGDPPGSPHKPKAGDRLVTGKRGSR